MLTSSAKILWINILTEMDQSVSCASVSPREGELGGDAMRKSQGLKYFWSHRTILGASPKKKKTPANIRNFLETN